MPPLTNQRSRRLAAVVLGGALLVVVVLGAVLGTRGITEDLTAQVERALSTVPGGEVDDLRVAVTGREVRLDAGSASTAQIERAVAVIESVDGVRGVSVVRTLEAGAPTGDEPTSSAADPALEDPGEAAPDTGSDAGSDAGPSDPPDEPDEADLPDTGAPASAGPGGRS